MKKFYEFSKNIPFIAILSVVFCIAIVSDAAAANIFETVKDKVYTTLQDLRGIIYIVGGFGLICFTFAAIFGHINFKHLATISFSLFLVAAMGLFISYFTGDGTASARLQYKDNTTVNNNSAPDDSPTGGDCKNAGCPQSQNPGANKTP
ncbi:MAG: hypothetical protein Q4D11_02030 [Rhodospirillales bacterium]|nr:hypothetical protein [Rhodospirillales bacterium]